MWYQSFSAMLSEIERISGINRDTLTPEIRAIHQKYRTSEYAFLIGEIPALRAAYPNQDLTVVFDDAIHAYRRARKSSLALYDGVAETLAELRKAGILIVLYTESLAFYTNFRVRRLGLDTLIDYIYSPPDHALPVSTTSHTEREDAQLTHAKHKYLPEGVIKPDPAVLKDIVRDISRTPSECVYLGDSLMKDIVMAQDAGITDVYAEYGRVQHREEYDLLRLVSHWTDADVQRERSMSRQNLNPSHSVSNFAAIKNVFGI
jgi:phosphoglycolate phosphatase